MRLLSQSSESGLWAGFQRDGSISSPDNSLRIAADTNSSLLGSGECQIPLADWILNRYQDVSPAESPRTKRLRKTRIAKPLESILTTAIQL